MKELKSGKVYAKCVFRGNLIDENKIVASAHTPDWALVPKVSATVLPNTL